MAHSMYEQIAGEFELLLPPDVRNCASALLVLALAELMDEKPSAATAKELKEQYYAVLDAANALRQPDPEAQDPLDEVSAARKARRRA